MLIVVDPHSGVPAYKQLMDQVKFHIASGLLTPGDELPSTRALSSQLGLNPMTISKAYSYLEREGVVERRPGRPLIVKAMESERARQKKIDQLRESFAPIATMIRQLGIGTGEALKVIGEMLNTGTDDKRKGPGAEGPAVGDGPANALPAKEEEPRDSHAQDDSTLDKNDDEAAPSTGAPKEEV
jgi:GntR family transcriptional regulator